MCRFIETIRIEEGRIYNLSCHNLRLNWTRKSVLGIDTELDLSVIICPEAYRERTKCRVEYDNEIRNVEYVPYKIRPVRSIRIVWSDNLDYRYKSTDRRQLDNLFAKRGVCDDILIARNGLVTDTSICNVALGDGYGWVTPRQPLLCGTKRATLLEAGILMEEDIRVKTLDRYLYIRLFNAMIDFGEVELPMNRIFL